MASAKHIAQRAWVFLDGIGWVIAIAFVAVALIKLHHDEQETKRDAIHTRLVQRAGAPTGVCLREGIRVLLPVLGRVSGAQAPLAAYVRLQSHRYPGVTCPEK
jgi:hypothetical protein